MAMPSNMPRFLDVAKSAADVPIWAFLTWDNTEALFGERKSAWPLPRTASRIATPIGLVSGVNCVREKTLADEMKSPKVVKKRAPIWS